MDVQPILWKQWIKEVDEVYFCLQVKGPHSEMEKRPKGFYFRDVTGCLRDGLRVISQKPHKGFPNQEQKSSLRRAGD